jgi:hypothetical protein
MCHSSLIAHIVQLRGGGCMAKVSISGSIVQVETDKYCAAVQTEGYVTGVMGGSFFDKATGTRDVGFGLMIVDFLLEPGADTDETPNELRYHWGDKIHGNIPKRYVELPQICTQAKKLPFEVIEGNGFVAVHQWFKWHISRPPYRSGSRWEQWLVFQDGVRWFVAYDKVTSANDVDCLLLRMDMPGHIRHNRGDTFNQVYLSYYGFIPAEAFFEDFPPDERYLYRREDGKVPKRFIRGYQLRNGVWLLGMCLHPSIVYEAWCHQRGYVCMIQEIGGLKVRVGDSFGSTHVIGFFEDIEEAEELFDSQEGATAVNVSKQGWLFER